MFTKKNMFTVIADVKEDFEGDLVFVGNILLSVTIFQRWRKLLVGRGDVR